MYGHCIIVHVLPFFRCQINFGGMKFEYCFTMTIERTKSELRYVQ